MTIRTAAKELSRPGQGKTGKVLVGSDKLQRTCVFITRCTLRSFRNSFWVTCFTFRDPCMHHPCKVVQHVFLNCPVISCYLTWTWHNKTYNAISWKQIYMWIQLIIYLLSHISVIFWIRTFQSIALSGSQAFDCPARDAEGVARSRFETRTGVWRGKQSHCRISEGLIWSKTKIKWKRPAQFLQCSETDPIFHIFLHLQYILYILRSRDTMCWSLS